MTEVIVSHVIFSIAMIVFAISAFSLIAKKRKRPVTGASSF